MASTLNVTKSWIKLKILFEIFREEKLYLHGVLRPVVQDDLLSVKLLIDKDVQIVFFFLNINGNVDTETPNRYRNWLCIILVLEKQSEILLNCSKFIRNKGHLYLGLRVSFNRSGSFELNLREELLKFDFFFRKKANALQLRQQWVPLWSLFFLFFSWWICTFRQISQVLLLFVFPVYKFSFLFCLIFDGICILLLLLFTLLQIVHAEELDSFTIIGFDIDFCWQSTSVLKREVFCLLFAEYDISKVNLNIFYLNKGFLTSTDKWNVNFAGL